MARGIHYPDFLRHRIVRRTAKYVYFDGEGEPCDEHGATEPSQSRSLLRRFPWRLFTSPESLAQTAHQRGD
jgi:hypothetical protein